MADFPRTVPPANVTLPKVPGPLQSIGQSGKVQTRAINAIGRTWTETWPVLKAGVANVEALTAFIENTYHQGTVIDATHYLLPGSGKSANGAGGGTPLVDTASQTGSSLITDGWPTSATGVVFAGDVFRVAGLKQLFRSTSTVNASSSGVATLTINPPIAVGGSPVDDAALTISGAKIRSVIVSYEIPNAGPDEFMAGVKVVFREAV